MGEFGDNLFRSLYGAGHLVLIVVVVVIIAETIRNLAAFTALFFSLGLGYYALMTGLMFAITHLFVGGHGPLLTSILQFELPGNLFFGCGIFTFLGFFLFADPRRYFLKEKTMRWLSLIPIAMAIASIVLSIIAQGETWRVPYWISSLFFVKDPSFLLTGIGFELVIFFIRRHMQKKYGSAYREIERSSQVQVMKNFALCGLILVLSLATYLVPENMRMSIGLSCKYAIGFLLIPVFVFMKPSGESRNMRFDWLYYALFWLASMLPTIIVSIGNLK